MNLQTADTCILYDSDWNPQPDLQAAPNPEPDLDLDLDFDLDPDLVCPAGYGKGAPHWPEEEGQP